MIPTIQSSVQIADIFVVLSSLQNATFVCHVSDKYPELLASSLLIFGVQMCKKLALFRLKERTI